MIDFSNPDLHDSLTISKQFKDLSLEPFYVYCLSHLQFTQPTPVQFYSITRGLSVSYPNLIAQSKSGTGKTLAFTTISICKMFQQQIPLTKQPLVLILEPTRQLAVQVYQNIKKILLSSKQVYVENNNLRDKQIRSKMVKMNIHLSIGGLPIEDDKKKYLEIGCQIVVGTVGRVYQLVQKKILNLESIKTLVLDEGDKLFDQADSVKKLKSIINKTNKPQMLIYSATYTNQVIQSIKRFGEFQFVRTVASQQKMSVEEVDNIDKISNDIEQVDLALKNISKYCLKIEPNEKSVFTQKLNLVKQMLANLSFTKCLIFVQKKAQIPQVFDSLKTFNPLLIHGSLSQATRIKLMNQLNSHKTIITSDLLARGIDIVVDLIILFNSNQGDNFWHRVGRTGRIGRKGVVISLDYIEGWESYNEGIVKQALDRCQVVEKKEIFGEYMTELGNWIDVDEELEYKNINGYRYFDEQEFQEEMRLYGKMEVEEVQVQQNNQQLLPQSQSQKQQLLEQESIPEFESEQQFKRYVKQLLECSCCMNNLKCVSQLTGYSFDLFKMV